MPMTSLASISRGRFLVGALLAASFLLPSCAPSRKVLLKERGVPFYVAHAGGGFKGRTYTNTIEAMAENYQKGYRFFEMDFVLTADNRVVILHDWNGYHGFANFHERILTFDRFSQLDTNVGTKPATVARLAEFLRAHRDAVVVTDCKAGIPERLEQIAKAHPEIMKQLFPHVFTEADYDSLRKMGFRNMILALYGSPMNDEQAIEFLKKHPVFAVSMPWQRAQTALPARLAELGIRVAVHTINDQRLANQFLGAGIPGIYSDWLNPPPGHPEALQPYLRRWMKHRR